MKRRVGQTGFTIVEMMIVLAITGGLFAIIALTLSGRQRSNEFIQASNDARSQIQRIISEVQSGYYPGQGTFSCTAPSGSVVISSAGAPESGKNNSCLFLGDVIQFSQDSSKVSVYPVAGIRRAADLASADPTPIQQAVTGFDFKYGLTVYGVAPSGSAGAIAILSSFGSTEANTGDQTFNPYAAGFGLSAAPLTNASTLSLTPSASVGGLRICLKSGGTDQSAKLTIGANNGKISVDMDIRSGAPVCN